MSWVALALLLAAFGWSLRRDPLGRRRFAGLPPAAARIARYRYWLGRAALGWGLSGLVALALTGRLAAMVTVPAEFEPFRTLLSLGPGRRYGPDVMAEAALGGVAGAVIGGVLLTLLTRHRGPGEQVMLGRVSPILPRSRRELGWAALLSLQAGVVEELYFRLALPLAIADVTGSALAGHGVATLMFGLAHRYQRWVGMLATTVMGAVLALLYLGSGALWLAMAVHVATNSIGIVLRPALAGAWRVRP